MPANRVALGPFFLALLLAPALSAQPTPVGTELQINTYTTGPQSRPDVAMDPDGNFIVVWQSGSSATPGPDGDDAGVRARRYASDGTALGSEFAVNTYTTYTQVGASVATDGLGNFVVVWGSGSYSAPGPDGDYFGIQGRRFNANGTPAGAEFQVNTYTTGSQVGPDVAVDATGAFVVVWEEADPISLGSGVRGRLFASNGSPVGGQLFIDSSGIGPDVDILPGGFVVVWATMLGGTYGRRFDSNGSPVGNVLDLSPVLATSAGAVASDAAGDFVVVWNNFYDGIIEGHQFASDGSSLSDDFQINTTTGGLGIPEVSSDAAGNFLAVWTRSISLEHSIRGRSVSANGTFLGGEFPIKTSTAPLQSPKVASDPDGDLVVVWSNPEIHGQLFSPEESADLAISKDDGLDRVLPGGQVVYTIVAENLGPSFADPVTVTDVLPPDLACDWTSAAGGGATGNTNGSGDLDESLSLPVASSVTYTVTCDVAADATGTLSNTATLSSPLPDPVPANNSATDDTTLRVADLSISPADTPDPVPASSLLTYTVQVDNAGPQPAEDVRVTSILPADAALVDVTGTGWLCNGAGIIVICGRSVLGVGSAPPLVIKVTTPSFATVLGFQGIVSAVEHDPDPGDNFSAALTTVIPDLIFADGFESGDVSSWDVP